jgi:hypothetical protein
MAWEDVAAAASGIALSAVVLTTVIDEAVDAKSERGGVHSVVTDDWGGVATDAVVVSCS